MSDTLAYHHISVTTSTGQLLHKVQFCDIRHFDRLRLLGDHSSRLVAFCRCGWTRPATSQTGKTIAFDHCTRDLTLPVYQHGAHTVRGSRRATADSFASAVDDCSGVAAFAVADGIDDTGGSSALAAIAAHHAVRAAVRTADATAGVSAATEAVLAHPQHHGDTVMAVAVARPTANHNETLWEIASVGGCHAYLLEQDELRLLTTDSTRSEQLRALGMPEETARLYGHRVHATIKTADLPGSIQTSSVTTRAGRLALLSPGVAKPLPHNVIRDVLLAVSDPDMCVRTLTMLAAGEPGADNATAIVADRVPVV